MTRSPARSRVPESKERIPTVRKVYEGESRSFVEPAANRFLKGPIPWTWLQTAANLPGKALHVALAIQFLAGVHKGGKVRLTGAMLDGLGVSRRRAREALARLEAGGLVAVDRGRGRVPTVEVLPSCIHLEPKP